MYLLFNKKHNSCRFIILYTLTVSTLKQEDGFKILGLNFDIMNDFFFFFKNDFNSKIDESVSLPIAKWEADLSVSWDHNFWSQICLKTFELIRNPGLQLIQYKILHRVHYTGHRMFRMGFTASNNCSHCKGNTPDNYIHALWFCPPVQRYWYRICEDLSKCLKCSIPASPLVCLLGDLDGVTTEDNTIHMAFTALCIAKKTVLMNWKNKNNLNINQYRDYLWDYISLETASADTLDQSLWAPLISSIT